MTILDQLGQALTTAIATAAPSTVHVRRGHGAGGSGIAWTDDLVVTCNFHTPDRTVVGVPTADGGRDDRDAEVIGRDAGTDVALLRVAGGGLTPARVHTADDLAVGALAIAVGRPGRSARGSLRMLGVVGTAPLRTPHGGKLERYVETDRQIPRGFAGGPLIDGDGAVIGMNTRTLFRATDVTVTAATLTRVIDELRAHGGVRRGYLGVGAYPAQLPTALLAIAGRVEGEPGAALVASLDEAGPAHVAGLAVGDLIVALAGEPITDPAALRRALADRPGAAVEVAIVRAGARLVVPVTLGSQP